MTRRRRPASSCAGQPSSVPPRPSGDGWRREQIYYMYSSFLKLCILLKCQPHREEADYLSICMTKSAVSRSSLQKQDVNLPTVTATPGQGFEKHYIHIKLPARHYEIGLHKSGINSVRREEVRLMDRTRMQIPLPPRQMIPACSRKEKNEETHNKANCIRTLRPFIEII